MRPNGPPCVYVGLDDPLKINTADGVNPKDLASLVFPWLSQTYADFARMHIRFLVYDFSTGSREDLMPAPVNRISVTTASTRQQKLLEYEAKLTGRSVSSLASALIEEIVDQKVHAGQWHPTAIRLVEELIKAREAGVATEHATAIASIREEEKELEDQWAEILNAVELPSTRMLLKQEAKLIDFTVDQVVVLVSGNWLGMVEARVGLIEAAIKSLFPKKTPELVIKSDHAADTQVKGYFSDGLWDDSDPRETELIAYGMKYGLTREESEDIYEWCADQPRADIRQQMRKSAGHEDRLAEGESLEQKGKDEEFPW